MLLHSLIHVCVNHTARDSPNRSRSGGQPLGDSFKEDIISVQVAHAEQSRVIRARALRGDDCKGGRAEVGVGLELTNAFGIELRGDMADGEGDGVDDFVPKVALEIEDGHASVATASADCQG